MQTVMKQWAKVFNVLFLAAIILSFSHGSSQAQDKWPREIRAPEGKMTIYQPQLESYRGDKAKGRSAISAQKTDMKAPVFGVVWYSARVVTDRANRTVEFVDVKVDKVKFPESKPDLEKKLAQFIEKHIGQWENTPMALDRFLALVTATEKEKRADDRLDTSPPRILYTTVPSVLIVINGDPVLREVENSKIERVINTPFVILFDPSSKTYFLEGGDFWYSAQDVKGPWKSIVSPPGQIAEVAKRVSEPQTPSQDPQQKPKSPPQVIVVTEPTELIVAQGEPKYAPLQGTNLLYMENTPNDVFMEISSQQYYVLLAGRWYRSKSLSEGPWTYVSPDKLSADFMKIPPGSDKGHILAFVAGTAEADEAVAEAQIPQTAAVKRDAAKLDVKYDGAPKFENVKGTSIEYAVNTGIQVLKVQGKYYACDQAIWYVSNSPTGPWAVADSIPEKEIQQIPPESPVYNVKYVHVYDSTPEVVYVGYTPGYTGTYIYGPTIVYGTGYVYPGWVGVVYYPPPITWGFYPVYVPYYGGWGYGWGYGAGFASGAFWGFAAGVAAANWWHGGGWNHGDIDININNSKNINANRNSMNNISRESKNNIYNRKENQGKVAQTRDSRPGQGGSGTRDSRPGQGGRGTRDTTATRPGTKDNVFAGKDGNVYRNDGKGGWEQRDKGSWSKPESKAQTRDSFQQNRSSLDRDYGARQRGEARTSSYERNFGGSGFSGGRGGGFGGGGRGGRR